MKQAILYFLTDLHKLLGAYWHDFGQIRVVFQAVTTIHRRLMSLVAVKLIKLFFNTIFSIFIAEIKIVKVINGPNKYHTLLKCCAFI